MTNLLLKKILDGWAAVDLKWKIALVCRFLAVAILPWIVTFIPIGTNKHKADRHVLWGEWYYFVPLVMLYITNYGACGFLLWKFWRARWEAYYNFQRRFPVDLTIFAAVWVGSVFYLLSSMVDAPFNVIFLALLLTVYYTMEFVLIMLVNMVPLTRYLQDHHLLPVIFISMIFENYFIFAHNIILQLANVGRMPIANVEGGLGDASKTLADLCWLYYRWRVAYIMSHKYIDPDADIMTPSYHPLHSIANTSFESHKFARTDQVQNVSNLGPVSPGEAASLTAGSSEGPAQGATGSYSDGKL